jgi:rubrerythrin
MPHEPRSEPPVVEPADGDLSSDAELLAILDAALADERAAQQKYRHGLEHCSDPEACRLFGQLLRDEEAHERALTHRYVEVKKRIGLSGAGRGAA